MDQVSIMKNKFKKNEILNIPRMINETRSLVNLFMEKHYPNEEFLGELKSAKWNGPFDMSQSNLETVWKCNETNNDILGNKNINYYAEIETFFGEIVVNRNTFLINLFPEHKYGNLRNPVTSKYVFQINRELANLLNSNIILYCCDSYYHPAILEEKAREGWEIEEIIEFGNRRFGIPPKELNSAIENLYFIDEFDLDLDELDPEKEVWSRAKYEYDKEQKGEPPYNNQ